MDIRVDKYGEFHLVPTIAWVASFGLCTLGDVMLGRWMLLPLFVIAFYGGTFIIALVTYPMLSFWRDWLRRRGLIAWYLIEVGGLWGGTTLILLVLSPWWLRWSWSGAYTDPGARLGALRRLGGGRDLGGGEDGMGKAASSRSPVSPRSRDRGEWRPATAGGRRTVSVRA